MIYQSVGDVLAIWLRLQYHPRPTKAASTGLTMVDSNEASLLADHGFFPQ
jgi:hypothetical protein